MVSRSVRPVVVSNSRDWSSCERVPSNSTRLPVLFLEVVSRFVRPSTSDSILSFLRGVPDSCGNGTICSFSTSSHSNSSSNSELVSKESLPCEATLRLVSVRLQVLSSNSLFTGAILRPLDAAFWFARRPVNFALLCSLVRTRSLRLMVNARQAYQPRIVSPANGNHIGNHKSHAAARLACEVLSLALYWAVRPSPLRALLRRGLLMFPF